MISESIIRNMLDDLEHEKQFELLVHLVDQCLNFSDVLSKNENGDIFWSSTGEVAIPNYAKFILLRDWACDEKGTELSIVIEDENCLYYYDGCDRWCWVEKNLEGIEFNYV